MMYYYYVIITSITTPHHNVQHKKQPTGTHILCVCLLVTNLSYAKTHTYPFNGPFSGTTRVGWYQKGETNVDFTEARDSEWKWYQLSHMQICTSLQTDNHASTSPLQFFTGRMPFLLPNQQRQITEGKLSYAKTAKQI